MCLRQRKAAAPDDPDAGTEATLVDRAPRRRSCACCCSCLLWTAAVLLLLGASAALHGTVVHGMPLSQSTARPGAWLNFRMMRLFRDLSRVKARRRRFAQKDALMSVLMDTAKPLPLADPDGEGRIALTAEELAEFDGRPLPNSDERAPLYLSIHNRIYDVTSGKAFYGPGRSYHALVGKDASRAFCTGCLEPECLISSLHGLTDAQRHEADAWIELYEHHDKYKLVGRLRTEVEVAQAEGGEVDIDADDGWEMAQVELAQSVETIKKRKTFRPK